MRSVRIYAVIARQNLRDFLGKFSLPRTEKVGQVQLTKSQKQMLLKLNIICRQELLGSLSQTDSIAM